MVSPSPEGGAGTILIILISVGLGKYMYFFNLINHLTKQTKNQHLFA